jgi:hypothetical protein
MNVSTNMPTRICPQRKHVAVIHRYPQSPPLIERMIQVEVVIVIAMSVAVGALKLHLHKVKWDKHCRELRGERY